MHKKNPLKLHTFRFGDSKLFASLIKWIYIITQSKECGLMHKYSALKEYKKTTIIVAAAKTTPLTNENRFFSRSLYAPIIHELFSPGLLLLLRGRANSNIRKKQRRYTYKL